MMMPETLHSKRGGSEGWAWWISKEKHLPSQLDNPRAISEPQGGRRELICER